MIQAGVNDARYNCKGTPTRRPSQIIPIAVALWATKPRLPARSVSHRLRGSFGVASSEAATVSGCRGGTDYKICLDAAFTPATTRQNSY
jgi:hypothetical protein